LDERIGTVERHFTKLFALYGSLAQCKTRSEMPAVQGRHVVGPVAAQQLRSEQHADAVAQN
jgi:hypothetical protein